jgi:2-oxoglutarate ferredoxin oxidoreductase subunit alpha
MQQAKDILTSPDSEKNQTLFTDGSRLITEALARAGADLFIGYPITPANLIYQYALNRFDSFLAAPDEISTMQWMCGFSAAGKLPVTATSFPGYALMLESVNMAYMMELPMVIILVQRLGPATGTATCGAQGDLSLINGTISGGYTIPTFSISSTTDCWDMAFRALHTAVMLRSPVILLASKEEVMTLLSLDMKKLTPIIPVGRQQYSGPKPFIPYQPDEDLVPAFVSLESSEYQVRLTASTHNKQGILQNTTPEALENTQRLQRKMTHNLSRYCYFEYDEQAGADTLLVSYGITARSAREAILKLRAGNQKISLLIVKTLLPVSDEIYDITGRYKNVFIAEENLTGQYRQVLFGAKSPAHIRGINRIGKMISPKEIIEEVLHERK